jgi:hypothetical protein
MTPEELTEILRRELAPIRDELASARRTVDDTAPQIAGIPLSLPIVFCQRPRSALRRTALLSLA